MTCTLTQPTEVLGGGRVCHRRPRSRCDGRRWPAPPRTRLRRCGRQRRRCVVPTFRVEAIVVKDPIGGSNRHLDPPEATHTPAHWHHGSARPARGQSPVSLVSPSNRGGSFDKQPLAGPRPGRRRWRCYRALQAPRRSEPREDPRIRSTGRTQAIRAPSVTGRSR